jgi:DHA2 family multidrug resistance protein
LPSPTSSAIADLQTKFLIFGVMAFGQFMALIDIQIVAASLNDVQAGLSAGPDEISWIQTGYLIAELIMIPFAAFLAQSLSTRYLFALSAGLFTLSSALCGMAWDIESMIVFRVIQGFVGGAMVPTVFATGFAMFEGKQRAMIPAILGMVSVLAPTLGPTVGGWITSAAGWRWIFYINIVPGVAGDPGALRLIKVDLPELLHAEADRLFPPRRHGRLPRRAGIRAGGRPEERLVRIRASPSPPGRRWSPSSCSSSARSAPAGPS